MSARNLKRPDVSDNPKNQKILEEFDKLIGQIKFQIDNEPKKSESRSNYYRLQQIRQVRELIKSYPDEIKSGEQLQHLRGVGKGSYM